MYSCQIRERHLQEAESMKAVFPWTAAELCSLSLSRSKRDSRPHTSYIIGQEQVAQSTAALMSIADHRKLVFHNVHFGLGTLSTGSSRPVCAHQAAAGVSVIRCCIVSDV